MTIHPEIIALWDAETARAALRMTSSTTSGVDNMGTQVS
jgi:hypothetical protein